MFLGLRQVVIRYVGLHVQLLRRPLQDEQGGNKSVLCPVCEIAVAVSSASRARMATTRWLSYQLAATRCAYRAEPHGCCQACKIKQKFGHHFQSCTLALLPHRTCLNLVCDPQLWSRSLKLVYNGRSRCCL